MSGRDEKALPWQHGSAERTSLLSAKVTKAEDATPPVRWRPQRWRDEETSRYKETDGLPVAPWCWTRCRIISAALKHAALPHARRAAAEAKTFVLL